MGYFEFVILTSCQPLVNTQPQVLYFGGFIYKRNHHVSQVHLYVDDGQHLLKHSGFEFFSVVQSDTFVLPCLPTHPDVNVTLWRGDSEQVILDRYISFDPKVSLSKSKLQSYHCYLTILAWIAIALAKMLCFFYYTKIEWIVFKSELTLATFSPLKTGCCFYSCLFTSVQMSLL